MSNKSATFHNEFTAILTRKDARPFLENLTRVIERDALKLQQHLEQEQWSFAKDKAHQLKGVFYLLPDEALLSSLDAIESLQVDLIKTPEFQQGLQVAIRHFCQRAQRFCNNLD